MMSTSESCTRWKFWALLAALALILAPAARAWADGGEEADEDSPDEPEAPAPKEAAKPADPMQPMWDARAEKLDELKAKLPELAKALEAAKEPAARAGAAVRLGTTQAAVGDFDAALKTLSEAAKAVPGEAGDARSDLYAAWYHIARRSARPDALREAAQAVQEGLKDSTKPSDGELGQLAEMQLEYVDRIGKPMADFSGKTIQGPEFKLSAKKGQLVFVHFWGVW